MALFLFRFFPVLIPLLVYAIWFLRQRKRAVKEGKEIPEFSDGPIFWLILSSLGIGILCFIAIGLSVTSEKGHYEPPHMEGDKLLPPKVTQ